MAALTVVISGDASKLKKEMDKINSMAKKTGQNIQASLSGGGLGEGGPLKAGVLREVLVLVRELGAGNFRRAASSATILVQRLGMLKVILNPVTGIIVGMVAGFAAAYKLTGYLVDKLSGLKVPAFHPEYIAQHLQKLGMIAQEQQDINKEIERTKELYGSVAEEAGRVAERNKEAFEHQRKMNEYAEEEEMAHAKTGKQREAVRRKYSDLDLDLKEQERQTTIRNHEVEQKKLQEESTAKKAAADKIATEVGSKESDENIARFRKAQSEDAQKYLDDVAKNPNGTMRDKAIKAYNAVALSGVSGSDLKAAEKANAEEARRRIKAAQDWEDEMWGRSEKRKRMEELNKDAGSAAVRAAQIGITLPEEKARAAQQAVNDRAEAEAKLRAESAEAFHPKMVRGVVTSLQQVGAFGRDAQQVDISKRMLHELKGIHDKIGKVGGEGSGFSGMAGVRY